MRAGCEAGHSHVTNRASNRHPCAAVNSFRETAKMSVPAHESVAMTDVDDVSITALSTGENHNPVADRSHRSSHRRCIVGAFVLAPCAEHWMSAPAEDAGDATERDGRAEECSTERL